MKTLCAGMLLLFAVGLAADEPARKEPWEWTIEERLAARFDPEARKKRIDESLAKPSTLKVSPANLIAPNPPTDYVSGLHTPELLLPTEIFSTFSRAAYATGMDAGALHFREDALAKAVELGLPPDFLNVLETEMGEFILLQSLEHPLRERISLGDPDAEQLLREIKQLEADQCPVLADALSRLRKRYGKLFDRFLYQAIAPGVSHSIHNDGRDAKFLQRQEEGCR